MFHWKWRFVVAGCSYVSRRHRDGGEKALLAQHESKCTISDGDELFSCPKGHGWRKTYPLADLMKNKNKFYTRKYPMSYVLHPVQSMIRVGEPIEWYSLGYRLSGSELEQTRKPTPHVTGNAGESPICTSIQNYCQCNGWHIDCSSIILYLSILSLEAVSDQTDVWSETGRRAWSSFQ